MTTYQSWGHYPKSTPASIYSLEWIFDAKIRESNLKVLPFGQGRSYGDCCLNNGGVLISTHKINRFISFDHEKGLFRCEAGTTLDEILKFSVPKGWFVPVTPGTRFVSIGGAIANDVHGKNHHCAGTFGRYVTQFELLRSTGERIICSATENKDLFNATIAGLGLTGFILWAEIQLKRINNPFIDMDSIKFQNLDEFFEISKLSNSKYEHTVSWLDCVSSGKNFGRGIFMGGNHNVITDSTLLPSRKGKVSFSIPFNTPSFVLNNLTVKTFNTLYYNKQRNKEVKSTTHYEPFFYPLDSILNWNKMYGKKGFFQFQCVLPNKDNNGALRELLRRIVLSGKGSFLAVLKEFGDIESPGMLSFPRKGSTLALDFKNEGKRTLNFLKDLDCFVRDSGGAIYPAKDAFMAPESFRGAFPRVLEFEKFIDPKFSSSFWRRMEV